MGGVCQCDLGYVGDDCSSRVCIDDSSCSGDKVRAPVAVLAEISVRSPRKIIIFIIKKYVNRIKVNNKFDFEKNFTGERPGYHVEILTVQESVFGSTSQVTKAV